jgi:hypothetical protein
MVREQLHRRVRRQVNRLWHLKERLLMQNVEDLVPVQTDDGETISRLETLAAPEPHPEESLIAQEELTDAQRLQDQFHAFLGHERALQSLYACLCLGISKRQDLARTLKVTTRVINNRLRRLRRQAAAFSSLDPSERIKNGLKKVAVQIPHLEQLGKAA